MLTEIISGEWESAPDLVDYRTERFSDMLVERATWTGSAPVRSIDEVVTAAPGYIWFRFWLLEQQQLVEKYFDDERLPVGIYVPITTRFRSDGARLNTANLKLALWLATDGRVTVLEEDTFEAAATAGLIDSEAVTHAEQRIRELTIAIGQHLFPPAMVRNFKLQKPSDL